MSTSGQQWTGSFKPAIDRGAVVNGLCIIGIIVGAIAFFWDGLVSLSVAWTRPEYSHGYFIPLIAIYLILKTMGRLGAIPESFSSIPGLLFVLVAILIGGLGNLASVPDITTYGLIIFLGGVILLIFGWAYGFKFWPAWIYLWFMLPLPNFLYWPLSIKLQFISSQIGVGLIKLLGISVYLEGNIIDLGSYQLQVAEACNGLRYLFPLMSFGFLFAILYQGPRWHKLIIFLASIPITILMNSFRIGVVGVLVNSYGIDQAEGFLHFFEGWIIFLACVAILYVVAMLLHRLAPNQGRLTEFMDWNVPRRLPEISTVMTVPSRGLVAAAVAICLAGAGWQLLPSAQVRMIDRQTLERFPMVLAGWQGTSAELDSQIKQVLAADDYVLADYRSDTSKLPVNLLIVYYKSQTAGSGIHSPEVCIPAGGWEVSRWTQALVESDGTSNGGFQVNRAIIQKGTGKQLVYYWFEQRGRRLTSDYAAKMYTVLDSMMWGRSDGALVRLVTPIDDSEPIEKADERLKTFLKLSLPKLPSYVP